MMVTFDSVFRLLENLGMQNLPTFFQGRCDQPKGQNFQEHFPTTLLYSSNLLPIFE